MTGLARRIEDYLEGRGEVTEGRVLSGDGYFLDGHLVAAVIEDDLCLHVGSERWGTTMSRAGVRPLMVAGRAVTGWVLIDGNGLSDQEALSGWIESVLVG